MMGTISYDDTCRQARMGNAEVSGQDARALERFADSRGPCGFTSAIEVIAWALQGGHSVQISVTPRDDQ